MSLLFAILQFCISDTALVEGTPPCRYILWGNRISKQLGTHSFVCNGTCSQFIPPMRYNPSAISTELLLAVMSKSVERSHFVLLQNYVNELCTLQRVHPTCLFQVCEQLFDTDTTSFTRYWPDLAISCSAQEREA